MQPRRVGLVKRLKHVLLQKRKSSLQKESIIDKNIKALINNIIYIFVGRTDSFAEKEKAIVINE